MFKCQKVQITADAESALRPSSVRVVTRKRKDRKKKKRGKEEEVRWEAGKRVDGVETERYEPMRNQKKKKSASLLDVLFFPWWSSFSGSEVKWGRGRRVMVGLGCWGWRVIVVVCARFFVLCVSGQLSAAVGWWLSLSMHGGALVLDFVQVLLLRHRQHRRQDLVVLPVCQAWNTNTQNIWELLIHRPALLTSTSAVQIKTLTLWNKPYFIC